MWRVVCLESYILPIYNNCRISIGRAGGRWSTMTMMIMIKGMKKQKTERKVDRTRNAIKICSKRHRLCCVCVVIIAA